MFILLVNQWYRLSIRNKFMIFIIFVIFCVTVISSFTQSQAYHYLDEFNNNLTSYYRINKLLVQVQENRQAVERYLREMNLNELRKYSRGAVALSETIELVDSESNNSLETYFLMRAIGNALEVYLEECNKAIEEKQDFNENYYMHYYTANRISLYIEDYIGQLLYVRLKEGSWFYNQLAENARWMKVTTVTVITAISILCVVFGLVFSNHITKPIRKLAAASLKMSEGNLEVKEVKVSSPDEVGVLADAFNKMSISIRQRMNDLKEKSDLEKKLHEQEMENIKIQQLLKEAEFLGLQSQINPHFLFNTLNIISRTSMFEKADNTTKLIQSLSSLFRYNIGSQSKTVPLTKEIEITGEYVYIQKYRFGDRMKFDVKCMTSVDDVMLPRFTLQPLIENAIIHGIEPKEEGGAVRIKVLKSGDKVVIKIVDNGMGMSKDRLMSILNQEGDSYTAHGTGIGLSNVMGRVKLFFKDNSSFEIKSKPGFGTMIKISIPSVQIEQNKTDIA